MKKFVTAGVALSVLVLAACEETAVEKVESESAEAAETTEESTEAAAEEIFETGDTVSIDGVELTITSAAYTEAGEYSPPDNEQVLTVEVAVNNTTDSSVFVDSTSFSLYDESGTQMNDYYGYDEMAISSDLNSGKNSTGKLYFDVTASETYELIYTPFMSWDDKEITFLLTP